MRVVLDTKVWVDLKKESDFLTDFCDLYETHNLEIIFSHGNFIDLVRREEQDELSYRIAEFTDEYLGPFEFRDENTSAQTHRK